MADPLGFISGGGVERAGFPRVSPRPAQPVEGAKTFKETMLETLDEANRLQQEATKAVDDLQAGQRQDVENVLLATTKADNAFRMLQSLRNRMMEAYEEVKQMRT